MWWHHAFCHRHHLHCLPGQPWPQRHCVRQPHWVPTNSNWVSEAGRGSPGTWRKPKSKLLLLPFDWYIMYPGKIADFSSFILHIRVWMEHYRAFPPLWLPSLQDPSLTGRKVNAIWHQSGWKLKMIDRPIYLFIPSLTTALSHHVLFFLLSTLSQKSASLHYTVLTLYHLCLHWNFCPLLWQILQKALDSGQLGRISPSQCHLHGQCLLVL